MSYAFLSLSDMTRRQPPTLIMLCSRGVPLDIIMSMSTPHCVIWRTVSPWWSHS